MITLFLSGAIFIASLTVSLFFLKFWRKEKDSLFLFFSLAFALIGIERIVLMAVTSATEGQPYIYLIRLTAFGLILTAIVRKNS